MKVFKVYVDKWDYDCYESFVVVAESKEDVKNMLVHNGDETQVIDKDLGDTGIWFDDFLGDIHIEEVNLNEKKIIEKSFNAG